jgi:hypothetical protein
MVKITKKNRNSRRKNGRRQRMRKYIAGDIIKQNAYEKILSIGYEFETSSLAKLTGISEGGKMVKLLNTDTARKDIEVLDDPSKLEKESEEDKIRYEKRRIEELYIDMYKENGEKYHKEEASFLSTNDISKSKFFKKISKVCETEILTVRVNQVGKAIKKSNLYSHKDQIMKAIQEGPYGKVSEELEKLFKTQRFANDKYKPRISQFFELLKEIYAQNDNLYTYTRTDNYDKSSDLGKYNINFEFWNDIECGTFADVEWVVTYYKPTISKNVILDTYINAIRNIARHLDEYTGKMRGYIELSTGERSRDTHTKITAPTTRSLFYRPDKGIEQIYYLQTHVLDEKGKRETELSLDDCCITSQMTFSTLIHHVFPIMKHLLNDSINNISEFQEVFNQRITALQKLEDCIKKLIMSYNNNNPDYKIEAGDENVEKKELVSAIKNYIGLIFFKLYQYINDYLQDDPQTRTYLKDKLYFNCRHKNYALYKGLKSSIHELFKEKGITEKQVVSLIQTLIVNEEILLNYMLNDIEYVESGAFSINTHIERNDDDYGDPTISLLSYFQFFEEPRNADDNVTENDEILLYDWLEYDGVDIFSAQSDIQFHEGKKNKVLIEFRGFQRTLTPYMFNMADNELKEDMTNGVCNRIAKKPNSFMNGASVKGLKKLISLYDDNDTYPIKGVKKTRKNRPN